MSNKIWYSLAAMPHDCGADLIRLCSRYNRKHPPPRRRLLRPKHRQRKCPRRKRQQKHPTGAPELSGSVGIVLPTKDEPRWIQDETRFKEALTAAGYDVEILFSQGDSAKEKANVESLITKGIQVLIFTPQDGAAAAALPKPLGTLA